MFETGDPHLASETLETERQTDGTDKAFCLPRRFAVGHGGETDMFLDHSSTEPLQWGLVWSHKHRGRQPKAKIRDRARTRREMLGRSPDRSFSQRGGRGCNGFWLLILDSEYTLRHFGAAERESGWWKLPGLFKGNLTLWD